MDAKISHINQSAVEMGRIMSKCEIQKLGYFRSTWLAAIAVMTVASTSCAVGPTWTGAGVNNLASNPTNWLGTVCPTNGDTVTLDATSLKDMTWDLSNIVVGAWNQDEAYTGTVTFATVRPGQGGFTNVTISGSCTLSNGTWTHPVNSGVANAREWLNVSIGGDLTLSTNALISANGRGYASSRGPAPGGAVNGRGAGHGGGGGRYSSGLPQLGTYGSIVNPTTHGSGAGGIGGGTIVLTVGQTARINGTISALGAPGNGPGAGGSIWLTAGELMGSGLLDASGGDNSQNSGGGGGGRISVILTNATSFDAVRMTAIGGSGNSRDADGAAGTIYRQTKDQALGHGTLTVRNHPSRWPVPDAGNCTMMPTAGVYNAAVNLDDFSEIFIDGRGILGVNRDTILTNFSLTHIVGSVASNAYLALRYTNSVVLPPDLVVSNYTLVFDVPATLPQDLTIASNGAVSHSRNFNTETFRLKLTILGNLTVQTGGAITADECAPTSLYCTNGGASYGGRGGWSGSSNDTLTYGSILAPTNSGARGASTGRGGGAIQLDVSGTTVVAGVIAARGYQVSSAVAAGSGGSIWLRTGHLVGSGLLDAKGGASSTFSGGGGRIAVILTQSESFGAVTFQAFGGTDTLTPYYEGAVGTVYRETPSQAAGRGDLIVYGPVHSRTSNWYRSHTDLPALSGATTNELSRVTLRALTNCTIGLTADVTLQDLYLLRDDTLLYLNGHTLTLRASRHDDWGQTNRVVYDGGQIAWSSQRASILSLH